MENKKQTTNDCCHASSQDSSLKKGILLGLLPHTFCIAFIIFSVLGVAGATSFFREWLMKPYFFQLLIGISVILAFVSAVIYLYQKKCLSVEGIRQNIRYLSLLIVSIVGINMFLFLVAFPIAANVGSSGGLQNNLQKQNQFSFKITTHIPCSGHAPLIISELKKNPGVVNARFIFPDIFEIFYTQATNPDEILHTKIFTIFPATKL